MPINLNNSNVATRENRIGSITGYVGTLKDLATQSECGTLKGCSRCFSQSSTCLSTCGLGQLAGIRDVAIIHHGPAGCSVASSNSYYMSKVMSKKRGVTSDTVYVGTDMNENDRNNRFQHSIPFLKASKKASPISWSGSRCALSAHSFQALMKRNWFSSGRLRIKFAAFLTHR